MVSAAKSVIITRQGLDMRAFFDFTKYNLRKWFPGHMASGTTSVQAKLTYVDCIIEVHDARIPISGRNNSIVKNAAMIKPHILVLNKFDLITTKERKKIAQYYKEQGVSNLMFTNCKNHMDLAIKQLVPEVIKLAQNSERYNRANANDFGVMIMGVPNVGKSSLINSLRASNLNKRKGTKVGPEPGITKHVLEKIKICEDPLLYVFDTPGILSPKIESVEVGLKLALCNTIRNSLIGEEVIADFLLYKMNSCGNHSYVDLLKIDEPSDNISKILANCAYKNNYLHKVKNLEVGGYKEVPDLLRTARTFVLMFQNGSFGSLDLDDIMFEVMVEGSTFAVDRRRF